MLKSKTCSLIKKVFFLIMAAIFILSTLLMSGCADGEYSAELSTIDDFNNSDVVIGIQTGTSFESITKELFPDATIMNYSSSTDLILGLQQGTIDGFINDTEYFVVTKREVSWLSYIDESLGTVSKGVMFSPTEDGEALKEQMDAFLEEIKADGTLDAMYDLWMGEEEPDVSLDFSVLTGENGTLTLAVSLEYKPYSYLKDGEYAGHDIDLMLRFCEKYGYGLELENVNTTSIVAGVISGKYDAAACGIDITEERAESVLFSEPYVTSDLLMAVSGEIEEASLLDSITEGFEKTFIREDRWELFLEGIGTTMLITVLSAAAGTALGFALYLLSRSGNKIVLGIAAVYTRIIAGMPVVVLLMILYYVVFASVNISGIWIASLGFALIVGAFVYSNIALTVSGVDKGQMEGALSLGYTDRLAFFKIILPQALRQFIPSYQGEIVSLVKSTAIVGYIAVEDLTKVSDIIRSNTYEAFFPLIATAIIYFLLTWIVAIIIGRIDIKLDWKTRNQNNILKGIKL